MGILYAPKYEWSVEDSESEEGSVLIWCDLLVVRNIVLRRKPTDLCPKLWSIQQPNFAREHNLVGSAGGTPVKRRCKPQPPLCNLQDWLLGSTRPHKLCTEGKKPPSSFPPKPAPSHKGLRIVQDFGAVLQSQLSSAWKQEEGVSSCQEEKEEEEKDDEEENLSLNQHDFFCFICFYFPFHDQKIFFKLKK